MRRTAILPALAVLSVLSVLSVIVSAQAPRASDAVAERVTTLTRASNWRRVAAIPVKFKTHHPQGMVKIGDTFFVSSVEIRVRPRPLLPPPSGGYDRDAGDGAGHLFKIDKDGNLLSDLTLGEGTIYHPGGIDYDGASIWVPVAEYRPNSRAIVYRVDPASMKAVEVFRFADHLGAIAHDTDDHALYGVSWGSRRFYRWPLAADGRITNANVAPEDLRTLNPSHYVDYQDCKYAGRHRMLCTGVTELRQSPDAPVFRLGGMELVDLKAARPLHQVPVLLWTASGMDMTHNPVWTEATRTGLRAYFMPEDDASTIYVYEVEATK